MKEKLLRSLWSCARPALPMLAVIFVMMPGGVSAQSLSLAFASPATNASYGAAFSGNLNVSPGNSTLIATVTNGSSIVPTAVETGTGGTRTITLTPNYGATGRVDVLVSISGETNQVSFSVFFRAPSAALDLTPSFASPVTNSSPGAAYTANFTFTPLNDLALFNVAINSGSSVVPVSNVTITTNLAAGTVALLMTPLTNTSGTVNATLFASNGFTVATSTFSVVFRSFPPQIQDITDKSMPEDGTTNVAFVVTDPDTAPGSLVLTASSGNTNLIDSAGMSFGGSGTNRTITLTPKTNINGSATITISATDGSSTNSDSFVLTVTPVADRPVIAGLTNVQATSSGGAFNVFPSITISDVDDNMPSPETHVVSVTLSPSSLARFPGNATAYGVTGSPAAVTTALRNLQATPQPGAGTPGTDNTLTLAISVNDGTLTTNRNGTATISNVNSPPAIQVSISPSSITEGQAVQPFVLNFLSDPDLGDDIFTLLIKVTNAYEASLGTITPTNRLVNKTVAQMNAELSQLFYRSATNVMTSSTATVHFDFEAFDGNGTSSVFQASLNIDKVQSSPSISGIPVETRSINNTPAGTTMFPAAFVSDADENGNQLLQASFSVSPALGTFSTNSTPLLTQANLISLLRAAKFIPNPDAVPVGGESNVVVTLTVTDSTGRTAQNNNLTIKILGVNNAPQFPGFPDVSEQPVLIPPAATLYPFRDIKLTSDDTNSISFSLNIDNASKGTLSNLGSFAKSGATTYLMQGSVTAILNSLTNISYHLNPAYPFLPRDPGGTTFTMSAQDYALLTKTVSLYIQVQAEPRHHLVTRVVNDGLPGSFTYALSQAGNNDFITFALPSYPAVIRMPGTVTTNITRNVIIKGPGANLLTISGDNNGDNIPDRQIFQISASVVIEGITLSRGTANYGGAVQVLSNGILRLRGAAVVDSVATYYGGGIDVNGGELILDGTFIARNAVSAANGTGGGGISAYTTEDLTIVNSVFSQNQQRNGSGNGGGAIIVENSVPGVPMYVNIEHSTFSENTDAAGRASAVLCVNEDAIVQPVYTIFADDSGRNLDVAGNGSFDSGGANLSDDSTQTSFIQGGQPGLVILLDHVTDKTLTDALLSPLALSGDPMPYYALLGGSPAINNGIGSQRVVDQRGVLRTGVPDSGAYEYGAEGRLVINEIYAGTGSVHYVELYVPRNSTPVNLAPYSMFVGVGDTPIHSFRTNIIVGTNNLFTAGATNSAIIRPGFGMIIAMTTNPVSLTANGNPNPVIRQSISTNRLPDEELISVGLTPENTFSRQTYLTRYLDPVTGTNLLSMGGESVALAPQFRGYALIPHSFVKSGPFDGGDTTIALGTDAGSPNADADDVPFGLANAFPVALSDIFVVTEDDLASLSVLDNDFDSDGSDRVVVVDVSAASGAGSGDAATSLSAQGALVTVNPTNAPLRGNSVYFDARAASSLQQLPVNTETIDTFFYEGIDVGYDVILSQSAGSNATVVFESTNHRLTNGQQIIISGSSQSNYNGTFTVTVAGEDLFAVTNSFFGSVTTLGTWQTVLPRAPTARTEASVTLRVLGVNDSPVANTDTVSGLTERQVARVMIRPELSGSTNTYPTDPSTVPVMMSTNLLRNDDDIDTDDTWSNLRVFGVMNSVNAISGYSGVAGASPVTVNSTAHGLTSGEQILIANYGGHPSYNGYATITVIDANHFTIPRNFVDDNAAKGVWVRAAEAQATQLTNSIGSGLTLVLRANVNEDHLLYDASASAYLQGLSQNERYTNRVYYTVRDRHGASAIGSVDFVVTGVNNTPVAQPDPGSVSGLNPLVSSSNSISSVLGSGLEYMYALPPASGASNRLDVHALDLSSNVTGTIVLDDLFFTDEDTPVAIPASALVVNDSDIDRTNVLNVIAVDTTSREGVALSLASGLIQYNPVPVTNLQALMRGEIIVDAFMVVVSDGATAGNVTSLVAVAVTGVNDTPVASNVVLLTHEDENLVFDPRTNAIERDIDGVIPDDKLIMLSATNVANPGLAPVTITSTSVLHEATMSDLLNELDAGEVFTNTFNYTIRDESLLLAVDDQFDVLFDRGPYTLPVLVNDRDYISATGSITIVSVGPAANEGTVTISSNGASIIYAPPFSTYTGPDHFRYIIRNADGVESRARVTVRMINPPVNGILRAGNDEYAVARGETISMAVLANDGNTPGASGLSITRLVSTSLPGQPVLTNNTFFYDASIGPSQVSFTYEISGGGSSRATADAVLNIIDRSGALRIQDDTFHVLAGSMSNQLPVLFNDGLLGESNGHYRIRSILTSASDGDITTNAAGTSLVYTPDDGFIGTESIQYLVADGLGATGSGTVSIVVGEVEAVRDFYAVAISTTQSLDVLENDRMLSLPRGSLLITTVSPGSSSNGTLTVGAGGSNLVFAANGTAAEVTYNYAVQDLSSPARVVTGVVTIATVANGAYANPDRYVVRGNGSDYVLNVLTNDISYPAAGKIYSIVSIVSAPDNGGTAIIQDGQIIYTPVEGFFGEERLTYRMSDAVTTDDAIVTITVRRGDIGAARDRFAVYYEFQAGTNVARSFSLPVLENDTILPPLDQSLSVSSIGVGSNAPSLGGSTAVGGTQSVTYRPLNPPSPEYVETFMYEVADGAGRQASAVVEVRVMNRASNLVAVTHDDDYAVLRNSTNNTLNVLLNDGIRPDTAASWTIASVSAGSAGATITIQSGAIRYTPAAGFAGVDTFTYSVNDGLGGTGSATVQVRVGAVPAVDDQFIVLSDSVSNSLDVAANDPQTPEYASEYALFSLSSADQGGSLALVSNKVMYSPSAAFTGIENFYYLVLDDGGTLWTGRVQVVVLDKNSDRDTAIATLLVEGRDEPYTNAYPEAVTDEFTVTEDDTAILLPLANDTDADANDRSVIIDISTASAPGTGATTVTNSALGASLVLSPTGTPLKGVSVSYDPRAPLAFQQLPVGAEIQDSFYYEIIDYGSAAVENYAAAGTGTTLVYATNHRLTNGARVTITGASNTAYNSTFTVMVSVVNDDVFRIPVAFAGNDTPRGRWEDETPRYPTSRDEGRFNVRVVGINDPPVGVLDVITNITERETKRLMVRPELANQDFSFPSDPAPAPLTLLNQDVTENDTDIDTDDDWSHLRVFGVMAQVNAIQNYDGTPGTNPVAVTSTAHGLTTGNEILIANYGGHVSYNGYHVITVIDANTFTIPRTYRDNNATKGVWVLRSVANALSATTDVGASVSLTLRANPQEDHFIYNASASSFLQGLAEGEKHTNRFYYLVQDRNNGLGIGAIDVIVDGVNNTPVANPDPNDVNQFGPLVNPSNSLAQVLDAGIDPMYILPPASGSNGVVNLQVLDRSGTLTGTVVISDIWTTDEETSIIIHAPGILANDTDTDRTDVLNVIGVLPLSREGAAISLAGTEVTYNPVGSSNLQALARGEYVIDSFEVIVSDSFTAGTVTSLVAVFVTGVNDTPTAFDDYHVTHEDEVLVIDPRTNDVEIDVDTILPDDRPRIIAITNLANPGQAFVTLTTTNVTHDATKSFLMQMLADFHHPLPVNQSFTNEFEYTVTDNSFLFATDDYFDIPAGPAAKALAVLVNDRDFTVDGSPFEILSVGPALFGGTVSTSSNKQHLIYQAPTNHLGFNYFRYIIKNSNGGIAAARVAVRSVDPARNGILQASDDAFTVAAGETIVMDVTANDGVAGAGQSVVIEAIVSSSVPGQPILTNNTFVYTANDLSTLTYVYEASAGGTSRVQAAVTVSVVDRRGDLIVQDDAFSVPPASVNNVLDVLANDGQLNQAIAGLSIAELTQPPAYGSATIQSNRIVYAPNPNFVGIEQIRYRASDGVGGGATGLVLVTVGQLETASDYYTVQTSTPAILDVLANDRMLPNVRGTLTIASATPLSASIGSISVATNGGHLVFSASGIQGQGNFDYVVQDASVPPRSATVRVTVDTVASGLHANTDRFTVRGGSSNYLLDVLVNDRSYQSTNTFSIISIDTSGTEYFGGSISFTNGMLSYTPAPGFFGEESFNYTMSDGISTDFTRVTVSVRRGDIMTGSDAYAVIYEVLPGETLPTSFVLPVLSNDSIIPALGQSLEINILGIGSNAPSQGGSVSIASNRQSLIYRPLLSPSPSYVETFTYEVTDGGTRRVDVPVRIRVGLRGYDIDSSTRDDFYTVAYNSRSNVMAVLVNDGAKPASASAWTITSVSSTLQGGSISNTGSQILYSAPAGFVGFDAFTYSVADGKGGTGSATVHIRIDSMPVVKDLFTVISSNVVHQLDVISNDLLMNDHIAQYVIRSVTNITGTGAASVGANNRVWFTPDQAYGGAYPYSEMLEYTVRDDSGVTSTSQFEVVVHEANSDRSTATITLMVEGRNDIPVITNDVSPFSINDKQTIRPFLDVDFTEIDEQLNERVDVTVSIDNPIKGALSDLAAFTDAGGGLYVLTNTTAAGATAAITNMLYTPVENRITVPTTEPAYFTITITDNKSPVVKNTNTIILVTATNDPVQMVGTRADQRFYHRLSVTPFSTVEITEVDDFGLQPLAVTLQLIPATNGYLSSLAGFIDQGGGVYRATNITAAQVQSFMRGMSFQLFPNVSAPFDSSLTTRVRVQINDGFALPIDDLSTELIAVNGYQHTLASGLTSSNEFYGTSVAIYGDYAAIGAYGANLGTGTNAGRVYLYKRSITATNSWSLLHILAPAGVDTNDQFGTSLSLGPDTLAVGAPQDENVSGNGSGAVYVFGRNQGGLDGWGLIKRIVPDDTAINGQFGYAVDLIGGVLAVGAPQADLSDRGQRAGAVYLHDANQGGSGFWGEVFRWGPTNVIGAGLSRFGDRVALTTNRLVVGVPRFNVVGDAIQLEGAVFNFVNTNAPAGYGWRFVERLTSPDTNSVNFGEGLAIDGAVIAVGAPATRLGGVPGVGVVHLYAAGTGISPSALLNVIRSPQSNVFAYGSSVSIQEGRLLVGAPGASSNAFTGSAFFYHRESPGSTNWSLIEVLSRPPSRPDARYFGCAMDYNQHDAIIGAPGSLVLSNTVNYAFTYRFWHNAPPVALRAIPDQWAEVGKPFTFAIPSNLFIDPDAGDSIDVTAEFPMTNTGLSYSNQVISGVPVTAGVFTITMRAQDRWGGQSSASFRILVSDGSTINTNNPYHVWRLMNFGNQAYRPDLQATVWGDQADPDGDGRGNRQEYVFGTNPNVQDESLVYLEKAPGGDFTISYARNSMDSSLLFGLQESSSLSAWLHAQLIVIYETSSPRGGGAEFFSIRFRPTIAPVDRKNFRVIAE